MVEGTRERPFVGRATELARLEAALRGIGAPGGHVAVLGGEAGIGKSRLLEAFADRARTSGATVLVGACLPVGHAALPYLPLVEALRLLVRSVEPGRLPALLGPHRRELGRLLPELAGANEPRQVDAEDDRSAQARLFELVLGVFDRVSRDSPTVLIVEDLQWADRSTLDLLAFLVRSVRHAPLLFVLSARTDELAPDQPILPFLVELERDGALRLELPPLSRTEVRELVEASVGAAPASDALDALLTRTGGNPFFAEQLVAASREIASGTATLPPALRDVLAARLASLPAPTRRVLRVAAAAGRRMDDALISAAAGLPAAEVADALREAVGRGLLVDAESEGIGGYAFKHALLQEVAYRELLPGERTSIHAAWARALEASGEVGGVPVVPGEIAYHWVAARDRARALPALVEAGVAAERMYAYGQAQRHFEAALELWDAVPDADAVAGRDRVWLTQRAAECAMLGGEPARAVELGRAAVALLTAGTKPDARRLGELHGRLRWFLWEAGDRRGAAAALDQALRLIPPDPPSPARARALAQLAGVQLLTGEYGRAAETAQGALEHARAASGISEEALALGVLGWARAVLGDVDGGERLFREGLDVAIRLGGAEGIALGYTGLASMLDRIGRLEAALAAAQDGFAIVERLGLARTYGGTLLAHAAKALFNLGRWDEAAAELDRGFALDPVNPAAALLHVNRARLDTNRGAFEVAERHLLAATGDPDGPQATAVLATGAELATWRGDLAAVRSAATDGLRLAEAGRLPDPWLGWLAALVLRAEADAAVVARARRDEVALATSLAVAEAVESRVRAFAEIATGVRDAAVVALCRAELGRVTGDLAADAWRDVAAAWDAAGRPYPVAYARFRFAESLLTARGARDEAAAELARAAHVARSLGAHPLLDEIERLARQARIDLTAVVAAPGDDAGRSTDGATLGLTAREAEVLALVAAGWSNQQIADRLFITRKTASVHVSNILGKLGAANRVEAAAIAHRVGLQPGEPIPGT